MPARAARTSSSSPTRSMCASAVSSRTRRKWCETSCGHGRQQLAERHDHLVGRLAVRPGGVADRLADVFVEQLDRPFGETVASRRRRRGPARAGRRAAARTPRAEARSARARCPRPCSDPRRRPDARAGCPRAPPLGSSDAGTPLRSANCSSVKQLIVAVRAASGRDGGGQVGVGGPELAAHDAPDRRERQPLALQRRGPRGSGPRAPSRTTRRVPRGRAPGAARGTGSSGRYRRTRRTRPRAARPGTSRPSTLRVFARTVHALTARATMRAWNAPLARSASCSSWVASASR